MTRPGFLPGLALTFILVFIHTAGVARSAHFIKTGAHTSLIFEKKQTNPFSSIGPEQATGLSTDRTFFSDTICYGHLEESTDAAGNPVLRAVVDYDIPYSVSWYHDGVTSTGIEIPLTTHGYYFAYFTFPTGCGYTASYNYYPPDYCNGTIQVRNNNNTTYQLYVEGFFNGIDAITWTRTIGTETWVMGNDPQLVINIPGTYCFEAVSSNGCTFSDCVTIDTITYTCNGNVWISSEFIDESTIKLTASPATDFGTYLWSNGATTWSILVPAGAGSYCVTYTQDSTGCQYSRCIEFGQECNVSIRATQTGPLDYILNAYSGEGSYLWSTGATDPYIQASPPGIYSVTFTDHYGCTAEASYEFAIDPSGCYYNVQAGLDTINGEYCFTVDTTFLPGSYLWSDGTVGPVLCGFDPAQGYWLFFTSVDGCNKAIYIGPGDPDGILVTGGGSIEGIVYSDPNGLTGGIEALGTRNGKEPMAGVAVILKHPNGTVQTRMTSSDGQYRFTQLAEGSYKIRFVAGGRAPYEQDIELKDGTDRLRFNVIVGNAAILGSGREAPQQLTVFPNPATDGVTVMLPASTGPGLIQVVDTRGHVVSGYTTPGHESRLHISLGDLASGTYLIRTIHGGRVYLARVIRY